MKGKYPNGLKAAMAAADIGPTELARLAGTAKQNIARWADAEQKLTVPWSEKLAPLLNVEPEALMFPGRMQNMNSAGHHIESSDVAIHFSGHGAVSSLRDYRAQLPGGMPEIDVSGGAGPGGTPSQTFTDEGGVIYPAEAVRGEVVLPDYVVSEFTRAKPSRIHWIRVRGDSMSGTLEPGDRVAIDTTDRTIGPGGVFVIGDLDGDVFVKRLRKVDGRGDQIEIVSDNPKQGNSVTRADHIRIIGRVVARISRVG